MWGMYDYHGWIACSVVLYFSSSNGGSEITTVEGLSEDANLDLLRELFSKNGALQCGFCTAGILASTKHFLNQHPNPAEDEIKDMLTGHICRCTGYAGMVKAIQEFVDWSPERAKK